MKSFKQYITEVFDKPYKWRGGILAKSEDRVWWKEETEDV